MLEASRIGVRPRGDEGGAPRPRAWLSWVAVAVWVALWHGMATVATVPTMANAADGPGEAAPAPEGGPDDAERLSGDLVPCPDCDFRGKIPCPECDGRGEIYRVCDICKGSGEKPCPVCTKPTGGTTPSHAGFIPCGSCGGRGTTGALERPCLRCAGAGAIRCDACAGKATVPCRREIFVRVCPRCRYVGRITCPTCGGTHHVSRAVALSRSPGSSRPRAAAKVPDDGARSQEGSASAAGSENGFPSIDELEARLATLAPSCEAHKDIFVEDQTHRSETIRTAALELSRELSRAGIPQESEVSTELDSILERAKSFRRRWYELRGLYEEERRSYENVLKSRELREAALRDATGRQRAASEKSWNERMGLLLRILEKHTVPLRAEDVTWIPKELDDMDATWLALRARATEELTAARATSGAEEDASAASAVASAATDPSDARTPSAPAGASGSRVHGNDAPRTGTSLATPSRATRRAPPSSGNARGEVETGLALKTTPRSDGPARASDPTATTDHSLAPDGRGADDDAGALRVSQRRRPSEPDGGSRWTGMLWGILGFAAASVLFLTRARRRDDDS